MRAHHNHRDRADQSGNGRRERPALRLVLGLLVICLVSLRGSSVAQQVDAPGADAGVVSTDNGAVSIFAPSAWLGMIVPVHDRIDLKVYGFYIGDLNVPSAQVDVPIRVTKLLTLTPGYLHYSVPASGLDELANLPGAFTDSYDEQQFRLDGTVTFPIRNLDVSLRNMYVRRLRPAPADDSNRYRGRIELAYPVPVRDTMLKPFVSYEKYYDHHSGGWNKHRAWAGVTLPLTKRVFLQPSYLRERTDGLKTIDYALFGFIVNK